MANRILTIDEICQHIGPIWYQMKFCRFSECVVYQYEEMPYFKFKVISPYERNWHIKDVPVMYGKTGRCWENKPSPADLAEPFEKMEEKGA